jgi:hypothetical protein
MDGSIVAARKVAFLFAFAGIVAAQGLLAVASLGGREAVFDGQPVITGRHPLHLVHGSLGARTVRELGTTSCYDPSFQAGYMKTPVFDGGSRPAEFVLFFASLALGRDESPSLAGEAAAYKVGLVLAGLIAPFVFAGSARGAGATGAGTLAAAALGSLMWWTPPCRGLLHDGDVDLLLAGLCVVASVGGLAAYHRRPGPGSWFVLAGFAVAGWYSHPVVWAGFAPVAAAFYLSHAPRHGLAWHLGYFGAGIMGLIANVWWLADWARYWWLRRPTPEALASLPSAEDVAAANGWSNLFDTSALGWPLVLAGGLGAFVMVRTKARTAGWLILGSIAYTILLARLGQLWPTLAAVRADRAALLAAGLAILSFAHSLGAGLARVRGGFVLSLALPVGPMAVAASSFAIPGVPLDRTPLARGLTPDRAALVSLLRDRTRPSARIFWEPPADATRPGWNWTSLLPTLTDRSFLGGLDAGTTIDAMTCPVRGRVDFATADPAQCVRDLTAIAERLNVGWVVCRAQDSDKWRALPGTAEWGRGRDGDDDIVLFRLDRNHSYVSKGAGNLERADRRKLVFTDLRPDANGTASLSFHEVPGLRVHPPTVRLESELDPFDPTPTIRLRLPGPVTRVTITWQSP